MTKRWLGLLLAGLMLCALVGCGDATDSEDTAKSTTSTTTTTTQATQDNPPLTLVEDASPEVCYRYVDSTAVDTNETLVLRANTDLTDVRFVSLSSDALVVDEVLYTLPIFEEHTFLCIETYINDAIPTRGVACTDKEGKTYYYAITYSGKDSSVSLTELDIEALSEKKLVAIEAFLYDGESNGFVAFNEYTCPEEISLHHALYDIGVRHWDWTEEETEAYLNATGQTDREAAFLMPVIRHDRAETEALIQEKLGISITLNEDNMKMQYIEELDAFFTSHTDSGYRPVRVLHGWLEGGEGGLYVVDYEIGYSGETGRVTLRLTEDGYQFVSNRYTEPLPERTIKQMDLDQEDAMETFLNDGVNNGFVSWNTFSCPEEVSLSWALYDGAGIGVGSWEWTDEEVQDYMVAAGWEEMYTGATRFARGDIEALLQEKLDISISDLTTDVDMLYIEKYDAYYHAHSDTQYQAVEVENGYISGNRCVVYYKTRQSEGSQYEYRTVILWITEDGYRFASNQ